MNTYLKAWTLSLLAPFVLIACGGSNPADLDNIEGKADWFDTLRVPHYVSFKGSSPLEGEIAGMMPGAKNLYLAPNDGWTGHKLILRQGTHLSLHAWTSNMHQKIPAEISIEVYRWQGLIKGWGEALEQATGAYDGKIFPTGPEDPQDNARSFHPLDSWEVPEDGRYLFLFHTSDAFALMVLLATDEPHFTAASCEDDPGICQRLDPETGCGYYCLDNDEEGNCTKKQQPNPYCSYYAHDYDDFGSSSWIPLDEQPAGGVDDVPLGD